MPNDNQMLRQVLAMFLEQQATIRDLARNDLLLIEASQLSASPRELAAAAATVRATLYSVDATSDRIRQLAEQARNQ